jgi:glycosyltransferase involved in cell wall biosynthesis
VAKLTVVVITHNEAASLAGALESVAWADEVVVMDSGSTDETVAIARRFTPRVEVRPWAGYGPQKNAAAALASHDWILSIDADERVTPGLAAEIRALMDRGPSAAGYRIPRVSHYLGRWIRSTDWYPDFHLRLYDRRAARWSARKVHESVVAAGRVGKLHGELLHYPYRDISEHLVKIDRYTTLAAEQWAAEGRRATAFQAFVYPRLAFLRNYVLKRGFRDGETGLVVSLLNSYYVFTSTPSCSSCSSVPPRSPPPSAALRRTAADVLPAHRHGPHVAGGPEPGPRDRHVPPRAGAPRRPRRPSER